MILTAIGLVIVVTIMGIRLRQLERRVNEMRRAREASGG